MKNILPVERAADLSQAGPQTQWLIEDLWAEQAVGILGGEPKCCKTFLALDMAVSVASGAPCLRRFAVRKKGSVLLFPAEDSLAVVRRRLEGISAAAGLDLASLAIDVITAPTLRLDRESDTELLTNTVQSLQPSLLILDPLIRLHRVDENDASQMAALLSFLRHLQRTFQVAVVVVHHARKGSGSGRPGQALRGSSELHGWGDSNLYLRRHRETLTLTTEHRAAASRDDLRLQLIEDDEALSLSLCSPDDDQDEGSGDNVHAPVQRVRDALEKLDHPVSLKELRKLCAMRTASVCSALGELCEQGIVTKQSGSYQLQKRVERSVSLSDPIETTGNGNGKCCTSQPTLPGF
jgi:hypothetical protein